MINTDGNLYALEQHLKAEEAAEYYQGAIEGKAMEIQDTLQAGDSFNTFDGASVDLIDFFAGFETEKDTLRDFLNETHAHGTGQYLRNKMREALEIYCKDLAKDEIDNEEPPEPECDCY